jgi:hypothetical protein
MVSAADETGIALSAEPASASGRGVRRALAVGVVALCALLLAVASRSMIPHAPGAVEELGPAGGGKAFYMKMLREQVAFKRREAARNKEEKAAQSEIGGVHIMRSFKQVMAKRLELKQLAAAKLKARRGASASLRAKAEPQALLETSAESAGVHQTTVLLQQGLQQAGPTYNQAPPAYQYRPLQLQAAPQYQVAVTQPQPAAEGYAPQQPSPAYAQGEPPYQPPPPYQQGALPQGYPGALGYPAPQMAPYGQPAGAPAPAQEGAPVQELPGAAPAAPVDPMAPSFVVPPTPASSIASACTSKFTVQALGLHQHDAITISLVSAPPGAGLQNLVTSNPGSADFEWTPTAAVIASGQAADQRACFEARDRTGLTRTKCITISVTPGNCGPSSAPPSQAAPQQVIFVPLPSNYLSILIFHALRMTNLNILGHGGVAAHSLLTRYRS